MWNEYCRNWLRWKKRPDELLDVDTARWLHENRRPYTVLVDGIEHPVALLFLRADYLRVVLLDGLQREWVTCVFEARDSGKVFLTGATYQCFRGRSDAVALRECHRFREDGTVAVEEAHFQTGPAMLRTTTMDVSENWAAYPEFGDYDRFLAFHWASKLSPV